MLLFSLSFALSVGAQEVGLIFPWWILSALGWDVAIDCVGKLCKARLLGRSWSCWLLHTFALEWNKCKSESQKLGGGLFSLTAFHDISCFPQWWLPPFTQHYIYILEPEDRLFDPEGRGFLGSSAVIRWVFSHCEARRCPSFQAKTC